MTFQTLPNEAEALRQLQSTTAQHLEAHLPLLKEIVTHLMLNTHLSIEAQTVLMCCQAVQVEPSIRYDLATVVDCLRMASSLHSDIQEKLPFRRYQIGLDGIWGNEASILLGDYLLSAAFHVLTQVGNLEVLETISAATQQVACGQIMEVAHPQNRTSAIHLQILEQKQASLVAAGAKSAAILGKYSTEKQQLYQSYGFNRGMISALTEELRVSQSPTELQQALSQRRWLYPLSCLSINTIFDRAELSSEVSSAESIQFLINHGVYQQTEQLIQTFQQQQEQILLRLHEELDEIPQRN